MNKFIIAGCLGLTVLGTSCAQKEVRIVEVPQTTQYVAPTTPPRGEEAYLNNIASQYPAELSKMGRPFMVEFAGTVCDAIDSGLTVEGLAMLAIKNDVDAGFIGFVTGEAIRNFCPSNQWFIDSALGA